jgi:hypothetical protein
MKAGEIRTAVCISREVRLPPPGGGGGGGGGVVVVGGSEGGGPGAPFCSGA